MLVAKQTFSLYVKRNPLLDRRNWILQSSGIHHLEDHHGIHPIQCFPPTLRWFMVAKTKGWAPLSPPERDSIHMIGPHHLVVSNVPQSGKARKHFAIACPGTFPGLGM